MLPQPASPEEWMRFARSDLEVAEAPRGPHAVLETLCFLAQQAAEKGVKAVLRSHSIVFPRTHNIAVLLDLLPSGLAVPAAVRDAAALSDYAVAARYPGGREPVTEDEYRRATRAARTVVEWAESVLAEPGAGKA